MYMQDNYVKKPVILCHFQNYLFFNSLPFYIYQTYFISWNKKYFLHNPLLHNFSLHLFPCNSQWDISFTTLKYHCYIYLFKVSTTTKMFCWANFGQKNSSRYTNQTICMRNCGHRMNVLCIFSPGHRVFWQLGWMGRVPYY